MMTNATSRIAPTTKQLKINGEVQPSLLPRVMANMTRNNATDNTLRPNQSMERGTFSSRESRTNHSAITSASAPMGTFT
jgi:phage antirepressor YoqD-like protein